MPYNDPAKSFLFEASKNVAKAISKNYFGNMSASFESFSEDIFKGLTKEAEESDLILKEDDIRKRAEEIAVWWWKNVLKRDSSSAAPDGKSDNSTPSGEDDDFESLDDPDFGPMINEDGKPNWKPRDERERLFFERLRSWMENHSFLPPVRSLESWLNVVRKEAELDMSTTRGKRTEIFFLVTPDSVVRETITREATKFYFDTRDRVREKIRKNGKEDSNA